MTARRPPMPASRRAAWACAGADRAAATPDHYVKTDSRSKDVPDPDHRRLLERHHDELQRGRRHAVRPRRRPAGHHPCRRPRAGPQPARHHPGLRRLPHLDARRAGRARLRHRLVGSDARAWRRSACGSASPSRCASPSTARSSPHITGKDIILAIIGKIGAAGAVGHVIEYAGSAIRGLSMEGRLTLCNMSIEAGGRAGMVAPDDTTFNYLKGKPFAPKGENWDKAMAFWRTVPTDDGATFDREVTLECRRDRADGDLGHQPRGRAVDQRPRARSRLRARRRASRRT